ncbi:MAG: glycosyltransferase family 2 protein [Candidatus Promineifilaceae bacterium]
MELVSIILTTLNSERYLERSIRSCLDQSHGRLELLVVDGGSSDGTLEIVHSQRDGRVRLIQQPANEGKLPGAINLGLAAARGDFITWSQDDSWFEPDAIESMLGFLRERPEVALVYTDYWEVDAAGRPLRLRRVNPPEHILVDDVIRQCFLMRRGVYEAVGPQETAYFPVHEVPWRIQVAKQFTICPWRRPLLHYTVHPDSLTGRIGNLALRRMTARLLHQLSYFDARGYRRRLAEIDVLEAYEALEGAGGRGRFVKYALRGLIQDPGFLRNRGLLKLLAASLLPIPGLKPVAAAGVGGSKGDEGGRP